jgi:hypothetical protein
MCDHISHITGIVYLFNQIYIERESYATVSREVQNIFVLRVISPIFEFEIPI